ncbi:MAG: germination protein YpeB, partial [Clostridia bacterium]|nr:germination protein YpeB [Clostridia bacterium]
MKVGQHTNLVLLAAAAVAAVVWGGSQARQKVAVQNRLEAAYRESFASVIANGEQVETSLAKAMAATTASQSVLYLTQVWHQAMDTQASLASLPLPDVNLSDTRKFLVQTADYAYQLARRAAAADRALNDGERAELRRLRDSVATLNETFHRVERRVATPGFLWTAVRFSPYDDAAELDG